MWMWPTIHCHITKQQKKIYITAQSRLFSTLFNWLYTTNYFFRSLTALEKEDTRDGTEAGAAAEQEIWYICN
jgi:hypothetical protein